jgi:hypothetical protein
MKGRLGLLTKQLILKLTKQLLLCLFNKFIRDKEYFTFFYKNFHFQVPKTVFFYTILYLFNYLYKLLKKANNTFNRLIISL